MVFFVKSAIFVAQDYQLQSLLVDQTEFVQNVENVVALRLHSKQVALSLSVVVFVNQL